MFLAMMFEVSVFNVELWMNLDVAVMCEKIVAV